MFLTMSRDFKIILKWSVILFLLISVPLNAQLLQDTTVLTLVKKDIDHIYNLQFKEAREEYSEIVKAYPMHPIVYLLRGLMSYWENYPMLHTNAVHISFEEDMHECISLSEKNENPEHEAEYLLANLCARGMLLLYYDDNDLIMEVTPLTISTYKYLRKAFDFTSKSTDLFYFTGVYNYYREAYPKIYPVYKSLAFLFPHGNTDLGLNQLKSASINSVVLKAEASYLLTWIYLGFENNLQQSIFHSKTLSEKYPENILYLETHIRNLLLMKNYTEAEKLISTFSGKEMNKYYQAQLIILKGILQEKKYRDINLAQQYYNKGISDISPYGRYQNEYAAYAYFGLSRINEDTDEKQTHKTYRKEAMKLAEFKKINFDK
jgi:hypothetical protein